jgi:hypothetical protein
MSVIGTSQVCVRPAALAFVLLNLLACGGADEVLIAPRDSAMHDSAGDNAQAEGAAPAALQQEGLDSDAEPSERGELSAADEPATDEPTAEERSQRLAQALHLARTQWARQGSTDYNVKTRRFCFCAPRAEDNVMVTVRDGVVVGALGQDEAGAYEIPIEDASMEDWYTVAGMFARIEANLASADRINVVYDDAIGFPSELAFDYRIVSAEEGEYFEMWDFAPLLPNGSALQMSP